MALTTDIYMMRDAWHADNIGSDVISSPLNPPKNENYRKFVIQVAVNVMKPLLISHVP